MKNKAIVILGPTATHKSEIVLNLTRKFPLEIISADSMQFYKGMDIGTDKIPISLRKNPIHHLIDIISIEEEFSIAQYKRFALEKFEEIFSKGLFPIVVGGSGLYIRSLTENFPVENSAPPDEALRKELTGLSLDELRKIADETDSIAASKIGKSDRKRMIRLIEYFRTTGKKLSKISNEKADFRFLKIGLIQDRQAIYKNINLRVDRMFEEGFVREVGTLRKKYRDWSKTALQAIGYKELISYLNGEISLDDARELIKQRTRQFAKRQITWFKKEEGVIWINTENFIDAQQKIDNIVEEFLGED
jgi:tRNA dimethylallyltransferase